MRFIVWDVMRVLVSQDRALANARAAATALSRLRVEREEVELFLADLEGRERTTALSEPARAELGRG